MRMSDALGLIESSDELFLIGDAELKRIHEVLLGMLVDFSAACKKRDIKWCLTGGSTLGAVRHGGFIPWDDDVDIYMTRAELERLKEVFDAELGDKYVLAIPGDGKSPYHFPRIYKKDTKFCEIQSLGYGEQGFFIDIFILENTYNNRFLRFIHGLKSTYYLGVVSVVRVNKFKNNYLKYTQNNAKARKAIKSRAFLGKFFGYRSLESWLKKADKCFSSVKKSDSRYVAVPTGILHFFGEIYLRDKLCVLREAPFEDQSFPIPEDYDYFLSLRYGDYMVLPPEDQRRHHAVVELDYGDAERI